MAIDIKDDVEKRNPEDLIPYQNNPKDHPEEQVDKIASSIKNFGFVQPIVVDSDNEIIIGHGRLQAAKKLDLEEVPVIKQEDLSEAEVKALRLADNRVDETGFNQEALEVEIDQLDEAGFDVSLAGFDDTEIEGFQDDDDVDEESKYTDRIEAPTYEVQGEEPEIEELLDTEKFEDLMAKIEEADIPDELEDFLRKTAYRHIVFDYENIAEFYAHQDAEVQELMEALTLVVIDYDKAIEQGFVRFADESLDEVDPRDEG